MKLCYFYCFNCDKKNIPVSYLFRKLKFIIFVEILDKTLIQKDYNELSADNEFDIINDFEKFRSFIYLAIIISLYSSARLFIFTLVIIISYYISFLVMYRSNFLNRSQFEYYFIFIIHLDF